MISAIRESEKTVTLAQQRSWSSSSKTSFSAPERKTGNQSSLEELAAKNKF
jgi:hypothetical protein